jgi:hypothetical protein
LTKADGSAVDSWISITGRTIRVNSAIVFADDASSTNFKVTSTLNDGGPTSDAGYTFTIVLSDPCKSATINSPSISTMTFDEG